MITGNIVSIATDEFVLDISDTDINKIEDYQVYQMYKTNFSENDIYQVYEKDLNDRIGWVFPIIALSSNKHSFANNKHFKCYAYVAYRTLIANSTDEFIEFHENTMILILYKSKLASIPNFQIKDYLPSLFQYGYLTKNIDDLNNSFKAINSFRIEIQSISDKLKQEDYPFELFNDLIFEKHPLVKFHVLYQNIELLISKILLNEINLLSQNIERKKVYTRDIGRKLENFVAESKRISKLLSDYSSLKDNFVDLLKTECNNLLVLLGKSEETEENIDRSLYAVRNFIVHDYRNIPRAYHNNLVQINCYFELFITDLLINYKQLI